MANQETQQLDAIIASRRAMLMGGTALAGLAVAAFGFPNVAQAAVTDSDILNFALNLEYLEAQYYTLATRGTTIDTSAGGSIAVGSGAGTVTTKGSNNYASCKVPFAMPTVNAYALEIANDERNHVTQLRTALGTGAVAQPSIDLYNSFIALGNAVGVSNFDPFSSDAYFLLGAYIFEDVGVSAYHGAAALISDKTNVLPAAAGIQAVEAYHSGLIRTTIFSLDPTNSSNYQTLTQKISAVRAMFDGTNTSTPDDIGLNIKNVALESGSATYPSSTIADVDANYVAWARTTSQVLSIVYAGGSGKGGFFPSGLNGNVK